jgi:hypothetical protein
MAPVTGPRVLAIMGSGETAPTMARVHRALFDRFGDPAVPGAILDTPYGFQENADDLSARTVEFFATNVGRRVGVVSLRSREVDAVTQATALARLREARYVMAGPGSPSYALRQWAGGPIPEALAAKLSDGGILTMASAAALTLGLVTIPVYEIYKVGEKPRWLDGLDLLGPATGLRAAVVPHYDNAEGGNHDTRFCYLGERRLRVLEQALPDGAFILGVDGHTALVMDLEQGSASIAGLGGVTVRAAGRSRFFESGTQLPIEALSEIARALAAGDGGAAEAGGPAGAGDGSAMAGGPPRAAAPLRDTMAEQEGAFIAALDGGDVRSAVAAVLELDAAVTGRIRAGEDSPDLDNADATFRSLIVRLGDRAADARPGAGAGATVAALVELLLELRTRARTDRDWATADLIRDRLAESGVAVRDGAQGTSWVLGDRPTPAEPEAAGRDSAGRPGTGVD